MAARGSGFWAVTRHADVLSVSRRPEVFSSGAKGAFLTDPRTPADLRQARQLLVNMDAPQHVRVRRLVTDPRMRAGSSSSSSSARARGAPASGNARLSYRRAEEIFEQTTGRAGQPRAHLRRLTYERGAGP